MTDNPYSILGVEKTATDAEIKSAYRNLAKKHHPDLNPGKHSHKTFSQINAAYDLLKDPDKRKKYDEMGSESGAREQGQHRQYTYRDFANKAGGNRYHTAPEYSDIDIEDLFGNFFKGGVGGQEAGFKEKTGDAYYTLKASFMEAAKGATKTVTMPDGKVLKIKIPEGVENGQRLRLKGQGGQGSASQPAGDAFVEIYVDTHPIFSRRSNNVLSETAIGLHESILGAKVPVETLDGILSVKIPKGANPDTVLRLKGRGIKGGDHLLKLKLVMPPQIDEELENFMREWEKKHDYSPRSSKRKEQVP